MTPPPGTSRGRGRKPSASSEKEPPTLTATDAAAWFAGRMPDDWFTEPAAVEVDREEILVVGELPTPKTKATKSDDDSGDTLNPEVAARARISGFREDTREQRIAIASEAERIFRRKVSWGVVCGDTEAHFTVANVPVMTRLRMPERQLLDTLIDSGVARSRSEALAWCVNLVATNEADWIGKLRDAMTAVEEVRDEGPASA